jgi:3-deoxy-7-phosphoheptulonate synthase
VIVDPAHAAGIARIIAPLARASIAAGADGVAVEVHLHPEEARSDAAQALLPQDLLGIVSDARILAAATGRRLHPAGRDPASA